MSNGKFWILNSEERHNFEELNILIKESDNNKKCKVLLSEEVIDLENWNSNAEDLKDFLKIYL